MDILWPQLLLIFLLLLIFGMLALTLIAILWKSKFSVLLKSLLATLIGGA